MTQWPNSVEVSAKRALLRRQTQLLGEKLPWLLDSNKIPSDAVGDADDNDLPGRCFHLAKWVLMEVVLAADSVQHQLRWRDVFERYNVPPAIELRVTRAVLEPTSRYAPGIFAMAEIVAAVPLVAARGSIPRGGWGGIARRAANFGGKISRDGSDLQVLLRNYLAEPALDSTPVRDRVLNPAKLRLDDALGISTVTLIDDLVSEAKIAVTKHIRPAKGVCVAMLAKAPDYAGATNVPTMYGAIWSAYTAAAERLIFSHVDIDTAEVPPQIGPDPCFASVLDALARERGATLRANHPSKIWRDAQDEIKNLIACHMRQRQTVVGPEPAQALRDVR